MPEILTPEDLYGEEVTCPSCEEIGYRGRGMDFVCEVCDYHEADEFWEVEIDYDPYIDPGPLGP